LAHSRIGCRASFLEASSSGSPSREHWPTGNLDSHAAQDVFDTLVGLTARGKTVIYVTHDRALAARATARIELLDGRIVGHSGADADIAQPILEARS
jgi:ABC-type polar amino acid transport system ATPase subunit